MIPLQNQVAGAYDGAIRATRDSWQQNLGMTPQNATTTYAAANPATSQGYSAFTGMNGSRPMAGYGAGTATGSGYDAAQMGNVGNVMAGQLATTNLDPYMNPYLNNVVDQTQADMERARLIEQNATNDAMTAAGAFGGSRHGIANAETNRGFYDRLGATTGQLRNLGFQNAQQAAFQDIGNTMQADLANQQTQYNTGASNAGQTNQARATGANNQTQASLQNANNQTQMAANRLAAQNDARRFGAQSANDMSRFNSQLGADLSRFNAGSANDTSRFNTTNANNFQQNQFDNQMRAASQFGNLSNLGFGMANQITANQAADGAQQRAIQQAIIDAAKGQFQNYANAGNLGLGNLQSGVASVPGGTGTTTSSSNPGIGGILGMFL